MDWLQVKSFLVAVLVTAAIYAVFPLLFALLRTSEIKRKKYMTWCICVTAAVALGFGIISSLSGNGISFAAALLWGTIFYNVGKSILKKRGLLAGENADCTVNQSSGDAQEEKEEAPTIYHGIYGEYVQHPIGLPKLRKKEEPDKENGPKELVFSVETDFKVKPKEPETSKKKSSDKNRFKIFTIVLSVVLVASVSVGGLYCMRLKSELNRVQYEHDSLVARAKTLQKNIGEIRIEKNALKEENDKLRNDLQFYNDNVVFVVKGSNCYHTIDCPIFQSADEFWAYNTENAKYLGYSPCKVCNPHTQK